MNRRSRPYWWIKRALDVAVGVIGLVAAAPVIGVVAAVVRTKLGSPVFFRQERPGLDGRPFEMIKFRTMLLPDESRGLVTNEQRMTQVGSFLRSTSLDELPSLWNVVRGDMSLVGPRPLMMGYLELYDSRQRRRHEVRPGLTGSAQVRGRNSVGWAERLELDVEYVEKYSLRIDIEILLRTVKLVVQRTGISEAGLSAMSAFTGTPSKGAVAEAEFTCDWIAERTKWLKHPQISASLLPHISIDLASRDPRIGEKLAHSPRRDWVHFAEGAVPVAMAGLTGVGTPDLNMYLIVNPELQGRGHGRRSLGVLLQRSRSLGGHRLYVELTRDNTRAIRLFTSMGFTPASTEGDRAPRSMMVCDLRSADLGKEQMPWVS